jgi:hypothetical protein
MYLLYIFPLSSTHLWPRCFNFFNPSKKNSLVVLQIGKQVIGKGKDLSALLRIYLSICWTINCQFINKKIYLSIALQPLWNLIFFSFIIYAQSVGLLGRGISHSQDLHLHTEQHKHKINLDPYPCLEWDSNPRSQCSRGEDASNIRHNNFYSIEHSQAEIIRRQYQIMWSCNSVFQESGFETRLLFGIAGVGSSVRRATERCMTEREKRKWNTRNP